MWVRKTLNHYLRQNDAIRAKAQAEKKPPAREKAPMKARRKAR
jgi:hypothetical protein